MDNRVETKGILISAQVVATNHHHVGPEHLSRASKKQSPARIIISRDRKLTL
jgi:hypothetical protein